MTVGKLSPAMARCLQAAPDDWRPVPSSWGGTPDALNRRALVQMRDAAGSGILRGFEWRVTERGRIARGTVAAGTVAP